MSTIALVVGQAPSAKALTFQFDYTYDTQNFFDPNVTEGAARRATLEAAANYFEPFTDNLSKIEVGTGQTWTPRITHPGTGLTFNATDYKNYILPEDTILIFAGGRDLGRSLGEGGPGGYTTTSISFIDDLTVRGQGTTSGLTATDFALWGGSIAFDNSSSTNWNNSHTQEPVNGENDLLSVAIHELSHVLGFGIADSWDNLVDRDNNVFVGTNSVFENSGNVTLEADEGHWLEGISSDITINGTGTQEAALDPSLTTGTRKLMTNLDYAGLTDVGWETAAVTAAVPFEFSPSLGIFLVSGFFGIKKVWHSVK